MDAMKPRFMLGRQSSLAPKDTDDSEGGSSTLSIPEKLDATIQLLFLANKGDLQQIESLLGEGVDVNSTDFDDRTALHVAACEGHLEVVRFLVKNGANVNARDRWGSTPLADSKHYDNKDVCKFLEAHGAKLPESSRKIPMRVADPTDVPEYEIKPQEIVVKQNIKSSKYQVAKWHGTLVAVKTLPMELSTSPQSVKAFRDELALLQKLRHPNVVQFLGAVTQNTPMRIVEEYCRGGNLHDYLNQKGRLETAKSVRFALDIARGVNYLHECKPEPIIHRDLKPRNILRDGVGRWKVADFGLSKLLRAVSDATPKGLQESKVASCYYMAPEVLRGEGYDRRVDVFSFAMILYQMMEGLRPFPEMGQEEVFDAIACKDRRPEFKVKSKYYPSGLKELIVACWDKDPEKRPSFADIIGQLEIILPLCIKKSFWRKALGIPRRSVSFKSLSLKSLSFQY